MSMCHTLVQLVRVPPILDNRLRMVKGVTSPIGRTSLVVQTKVELTPTSSTVTSPNIKVKVRRETILDVDAQFLSPCRIINQSVTSSKKKVSGHLYMSGTASVRSQVHGNTATVNKPPASQPDKSAAEAAPGDQ